MATNNSKYIRVHPPPPPTHTHTTPSMWIPPPLESVLCYEASTNKTNSPLTSEIIGVSSHQPPPTPFEVSAPTTNPVHPSQLHKKGLLHLFLISLSSFKNIGRKLHKLMCRQPLSLQACIFIKTKFLKKCQKYKYWHSVKAVIYTKQCVKGPIASNLKTLT